jgi:hypothetical protein
VEDLLIHQGRVLWTTCPFSQRWEHLLEFWEGLPRDQPLLGVTPRLVEPICLEDWPLHYDFAIYWIIQPDHAGQARWYWKDVVTHHTAPTYVAPQLKRNAEVLSVLCAYCMPNTKMALPDIYTLQSQEGGLLGLASISSLELSQSLRSLFGGTEEVTGVPVEVKWNDTFSKYQILRVLPSSTPITTHSFFHHMISS